MGKPGDESKLEEVAENTENEEAESDGAPATRRIGEMINETFELVTRMMEEGKPRRHPRGVMTGFRGLDGLTGGLWPGEVLCVAGGPGVGKTAFALKAALNAAQDGAKVIVFTLESGADAAALRMMSAASRVPYERLRAGKLDSDDWTSICDASNRLSKLDIELCADPHLTPSGMEEAILRSAAHSERALAVLDGACTPSSRWYEHVKAAARKAGISAIFTHALAGFGYGAGAQLRRDGYPRCDILKETRSDAWADAVLLLDRSLDEAEERRCWETGPRRNVAEAVLAKSRCGNVGRFKLAYVPKCMYYVDFAEDPCTWCGPLGAGEEVLP